MPYQRLMLEKLQPYKNTNVTLLWSGGVDSTALLLGLLEVGAIKAGIKGEE